jgi:manganese/zinc/iron transport system permease protein
MDQFASFWIILTGALAAASCALLGTYLVLRKMSLIGDAISHSVLAGIALAYLLSGSRSIIPMFIGASAFGVVAALLIESLHKKWGVYEDASIGIVFTTLFAIGVVLISNFAGHIDLDQECVLYGEIAYTPWDLFILNGTNLGPRAVWLLGFVFALDLLLVVLLYKELMLASFDPGMAVSLGISATALHYVLMTAVSMTTVAAFESVGAILVVAMLIVPGATAYLLTDRLKVMLVLSVAIGVASAAIGYYLAGIWDSSIAGAMTISAGGLFALAFIFSPRYGLLGKAVHHFKLSIRFAADHMLLTLSREAEGRAALAHSREQVLIASSAAFIPARLALLQNIRSGFIGRIAGNLMLTERGKRMADKLLQGHRLWETFLNDKVGLPADHIHEAANRMEHFLDDRLKEDIFQEIGGKRLDPHGREIPKADNANSA